MPKLRQLIGLFGGTFDPIHLGHLDIAKKLLNQYPFASIQFIPCHQPPELKSPHANAEHRLAMVRMAIVDYPQFSVNDIEMSRSGPSYTVDTLAKLREQMPDQSFCLILGSDVFAKFNQWEKWQDILKLTHIVVVNRLNCPLPQEGWLKQLLLTHQTQDETALTTARSGLIFLSEITVTPHSATEIRHKIANGENLSSQLPPSIIEYIKAHGLYTT